MHRSQSIAKIKSKYPEGRIVPETEERKRGGGGGGGQKCKPSDFNLSLLYGSFSQGLGTTEFRNRH